MKARVGLGVRYGHWPWTEQYRDGCMVGPESELNEIRIRVLDEPRRFNGKPSALLDQRKVRKVQIFG